MTKVTRGDLESLAADASLHKLESLSTSLKAAKTPMDNFVNYSGRRLKGKGYDAIRTHLAYFVAAMEKLSILDDNAHDNIVAADKNLIAFMEDYDMLDDARMETLANGLNYIGRRIGEVQWQLNNSELTESERSSLYSTYNYYMEKYKELDKEYRKLQKLAPKDSETGVCIDYIQEDIQTIKGGLANFTEGVK